MALNHNDWTMAHHSCHFLYQAKKALFCNAYIYTCTSLIFYIYTSFVKNLLPLQRVFFVVLLWYEKIFIPLFLVLHLFISYAFRRRIRFDRPRPCVGSLGHLLLRMKLTNGERNMKPTWWVCVGVCQGVWHIVCVGVCLGFDLVHRWLRCFPSSLACLFKCENLLFWWFWRYWALF